MACMTHDCRCGYMEFSNNILLVCPKCGSTDIVSHYDDDYGDEKEGDDE